MRMRHFLFFAGGVTVAYVLCTALGFDAWQGLAVAVSLIVGNALGRWLR